MKLAIVLFLCLIPLTLEPFTSIEERFAGFDGYVLMEQDATSVEREFQKYLWCQSKTTGLSMYSWIVEFR